MSLASRVGLPGTPARQDVTCPYCFAALAPQRILFRCRGQAGRRRGCAPVLDEAYAEYTGSTAGASLPPVFAAPGRVPGRIPGRGAGRGAGRGPAGRGGRAECPGCGQPTGSRACPECHSPLPSAYCDSPGRIVALVGAKNAGKSTYIAVLLHELMNRVGTELDASLVACDDRTIERYKRDFARPLLEEHRLLPTTASAATGPREPLVYLLTRTLRSRFARDRTDSLALVLFDTAGEDLRSREARDLHLRYLEAADAIIFLVDPLELPGARTAVLDAVPGLPPVPGDDPDSEPVDVIARVTEALRQRHGTRPGERLPVPAAVALTKIDALRPAPLRQSALHRSRGGSGVLDLDDRDAVNEQVRALLHEWQAGRLEVYLEQQYADFALFGLSALGGVPEDGRVGAGGVRPHRAEDPLLWLLYRFGMLGGVRTGGS
ncbi:MULTISPECIES: TRAFAC clade GTPase domain-containing protein [Thermomonosporaceae]|uniref:TRAFAC clade GTPase domain-containing protein n=1 Tax=Thermomonosporaceae TaxID=2012 RepID=UPI00255B2A93|nr:MULTISPECIES: GTPase [Thermomonosporaceae]MDL4774601.1 50S ribosome-binding GTPase [Actinomadura xylanilytica]